VKPDWKAILRFYAGPAALERVRDAGLGPEDLGVVAGPATGPRWIVLAGIDRALADSRWLDRGRDLWLWGASAAAWRFAAMAQKDPSSAIRAFHESYAGMSFERPIDRAGVRRVIEQALGAFMPRSAEEREALARGDGNLRLAVVTVRQHPWVEGMERTVYLSSLLLNLIHPSAGEWPVERVVFHSSAGLPPQLRERNFPGRAVALTGANIERALLASGSVPFRVLPVTAIQGAPRGLYQDGGLLDYHINACLYPAGDDRLTLLVIHPGRLRARWMDRFAPWRRLTGPLLDRLIIVQPSGELLDLLPGRRLPSRNDWETMEDQDERASMWRTALETCLPLGEVFMEAVESGSVRARVRPLSENPFL